MRLITRAKPPHTCKHRLTHAHFVALEDCAYDRDPVTGTVAGNKGTSMQERAESMVALANCCGAYS